MTAPLCFIDTETTSLAEDREAWEIAMIRQEPGGLRAGTSFFVSDVDLRRADPQALAVGRFYDRHPLYAGTPADPRAPRPLRHLAEMRGSGLLRTKAQAAAEVERWTRGAVLVGSNPGFDKEVVEPLLRRAGLAPAWHYRPVDVATLAAGWLCGRAAHFAPRVVLGADLQEIDMVSIADAVRRAPLVVASEPEYSPGFDPAVLEVPWSSESLSRAVGLPPVPEEERHTAMGDARWCQRLYNLITTGRVIPELPRADAADGAA